MTMALDLLRDLTQLTVDPSLLLTALAAAILAGAVFVAVLALLSGPAGTPMVSRVCALREKSWGAAFGRQRDPDAAGRPRPRAPSKAPAAC